MINKFSTGLVKNWESFNESKKDKFPNLREVIIDGWKIIYGRDAKSNDYLTEIITQDSDFWLHAKGYPGSHVVIKADPNRAFTNEIKMEGAKIAAKNSKAPDQCVVVGCRGKFVTKDSTMKVGQVIVDYKNAEQFEVNL
jgi:predicted ribosome quality control (RQC) complex YloA/Tae2 family protein